MRFLTEANLTQVIRRQENLIDAGEARAVVNDAIRRIFKNTTLDLIAFASEPGDVPDDSGDGKPYLVLVGYDADSVRASEVTVPPLVERIFRHEGASGTDFRRQGADRRRPAGQGLPRTAASRRAGEGRAPDPRHAVRRGSRARRQRSGGADGAPRPLLVRGRLRHRLSQVGGLKAGQ